MFCIFLPYQVLSQTVFDIQRNGKKIKNGEHLYLKFIPNPGESATCDYKHLPSYTYKTLIENSLFLAKDNEVRLFIEPLNPLIYSFGAEVSYKRDPFDEVFLQGVEGITTMLKDLDVNSAKANCDLQSNRLTEGFESLRTAISKEVGFKTIFDQMLRINYFSEASTKLSIRSISNLIIKDSIRMSLIDTDLDGLGKDIDDIAEKEGDCAISFEKKYIMRDILASFRAAHKQQTTKLTKLRDYCNKLVRVYNQAVTNGWYVPLNKVLFNDTNYAVVKLEIKRIRYEFKNDEIVSQDDTVLQGLSIKLRKYEYLLPKLSTTAAYSFISNPIYGTVKDSTGTERVADPTYNDLSKFNGTMMVDFYIRAKGLPEAFHPFFQLGAGINSGVPAGFVGLGSDIKISEKRRIGVSVGLIQTWTKDLTNLQVGDKVSGTSQLNEDLSYQFNGLLQGYFGLYLTL